MGLAISCLTLAAPGAHAFAAAPASVGICLAILLELALAIAFLAVRREDRPMRKP